MWRPSPLENSDETVTGMWTSSAEETTPKLWEARSREEIGEAVLQNALTSFPRVILFGAGKTAITGWRGRGPNLTSQHTLSGPIPPSGWSVFTIVVQSGGPRLRAPGLVGHAMAQGTLRAARPPPPAEPAQEFARPPPPL